MKNKEEKKGRSGGRERKVVESTTSGTVSGYGVLGRELRVRVVIPRSCRVGSPGRGSRELLAEAQL